VSKIQVVVNIYGGLVQDVYSSADDVEFIVVDWDTEGCILSDDDAVARVAESGGRENLAFVSKRHVEPIKQLAGTEAEAAIRYAQEHGFRDFENEPVS